MLQVERQGFAQHRHSPDATTVSFLSLCIMRSPDVSGNAHGPHHREAVFHVGPTSFEVIPADALPPTPAAYGERPVRRVGLARPANRRHAPLGRLTSGRLRPKPGDGQSPQAFTKAGRAESGM